MPMKILITGGAGYLGSVLTPHLLSLGHRVTVLDNLTYSQTPLLDSCNDTNFDFVYGDTRDERVLQPLVSKADCILPLAAMVGAPSCAKDQIGATTVNRNAIMMISRMRSKSQRLLFPTTNWDTESANRAWLARRRRRFVRFLFTPRRKSKPSEHYWIRAKP